MLPALTLLLSAAAFAQTGSLEDRVKALELRMAETGEAGPDAAKTSGAGSAVDVYFDKGLNFKSEDEKFAGRLGAYVIVHFSAGLKENERNQIDTFTIRQSGIDVGARFSKAFEVFISPRFLSGTADLFLGWVEFNMWKELKLRAGLYKEPYSIETGEHVLRQDMPENSFVFRHDPARDVGLMAFGEAASGVLRYWAGVFNGNGQGPNDENSDKDVAARLLIVPGSSTESGPFKHLYVGGAATHGRWRRGVNQVPFTFEWPVNGRDFLVPTGLGENFRVDDDVTRAAAILMWLWGPMEFKTEWSYYRAKIEWNDDVDTWNSYSNYASLGLWIGGSRAPFNRPKVDKALFDGGFGALQFVARYSKLYLGSEFQDRAGFAGTNHAREYAAAVNWFPNAHTRLSVMYAMVEYGSERCPTPAGLIDDEDVIIVRAQIDF
jgi:phosphate-selective porin